MRGRPVRVAFRGAATLLGVSLIVFLVMDLLPGDPAAVMLGMNATPDALAALHHALGLDRPLPLRFAVWLAGLATLHLGTSLAYGIPVAALIGTRLLVTLPLAAMAVLLSLLIGVPTGVFAASRRGRASDVLAMGATQLFKAVPDFWLGVVLILVFALQAHLLPVGGFPGWHAGAARALAALALPSLALALPNAAIIARMMRSATIAALEQDYVRVARAKGLGRAAALWRHAVPNALVPTVATLGLQVPLMLSGAILVENVFALPGIGRLLLQAIDGRDLVVVQDLVLMLAAAVVLANVAVRAALARLDPRAGDRRP